jgi:hypothetical protein
MDPSRQLLYNVLEDLPENKLKEILDFAWFIKKKNDNAIFDDLAKAGESSMDFWNNDIDDTVWSNI